MASMAGSPSLEGSAIEDGGRSVIQSLRLAGVIMDRSTPFFRRLLQEIREKIAAGEWPPGHKIPSTADLADQFGYSRGTVRAAVDRLKERGELEGQPGVGGFVPERRPN